jgi:hypothetical protein
MVLLAITDDSFAQPYVLLSARIASESGYFGEKLAAARQQLENSWRTRSRELAPSYPGTDISERCSSLVRFFKKPELDGTIYWSSCLTCGRRDTSLLSLEIVQ